MFRVAFHTVVLKAACLRMRACCRRENLGPSVSVEVCRVFSSCFFFVSSVRP